MSRPTQNVKKSSSFAIFFSPNIRHRSYLRIFIDFFREYSYKHITMISSFRRSTTSCNNSHSPWSHTRSSSRWSYHVQLDPTLHRSYYGDIYPLATSFKASLFPQRQLVRQLFKLDLTTLFCVGTARIDGFLLNKTRKKKKRKIEILTDLRGCFASNHRELVRITLSLPLES